jgi:hypothetical protein
MLPRTLPVGFIAPCLPTKALHPRSGEAWLHEIKHDGFRVIARKEGARVRLNSRPGNDLTDRFPLIAVLRLSTVSWDREKIDWPSSFSPRKRHEAVPVWHFYFLQRLRVHRIAVRADAVEVQNIGNHCIDLVVGQ